MAIVKGPAVQVESTEIKPPPEHLSYSQITSLSGAYKYSCSRKWAYEKLLGVPWVSSGALICGSSFDLGANTFFEGRMGLLANVNADDLDDCLASGIKAAHVSLDALIETETFRVPMTGTQASQYKEALRLGLTAFAMANRETKVGAVQTRHEFTVNGRTVIGFSDRIDADGTIVDHKWSGSARWDKDGNWDMGWINEKRDQLAIYWLSRMAEYRRWLKEPRETTQDSNGEEQPQFGPPVEPAGKIVVVYMRANSKTPQVKEYKMEFTNEDKERVLGIILEADAIAKSGRYPARPGDACGFCSSVDRCRTDSLRADPSFADLTGLPMAVTS
jgi:hypothetical protein